MGKLANIFPRASADIAYIVYVELLLFKSKMQSALYILTVYDFSPSYISINIYTYFYKITRTPYI